MKKLALFLTTFISVSSFADEGWVGRGSDSRGDNPQKATVKWIEQHSSGWVRFQINEASRSVPAGRIYKFDGNSSVGKNTLAILLTAKSVDLPIHFYEIENYEDGLWRFDNLAVSQM